MKSLIFFLAIVYMCNGQSVSMNSAMIKFFEEFRCRMFQDQTDAIGIPILEPFEPEEMEIELNEDIGTIKAVLKNLRVDGISKFYVNSLNFDPLTLDFFLDISLESLKASGHYWVEGELTDLMDLTGTGNFDFTMDEIHLYLVGKSYHHAGLLTWGLPELDAEFTMGKMSGFIEGVMYDEKVTDFINHVINEIGAELVNTVFPELVPEIHKMADEMTAESLDGLTLLEFLNILYLIQPFLPDLDPSLECEYIWPRPDVP